MPDVDRTPSRNVAMATVSDAELDTPPPIGTAPTIVAVNSRRLPSGIYSEDGINVTHRSVRIKKKGGAVPPTKGGAPYS